jgi:glycosyltransferase involved in cell wall biosynthesis
MQMHMNKTLLFIRPNALRPDLPNFSWRYQHLPAHIGGHIITVAGDEYDGMTIGNVTLHAVSCPLRNWKTKVTTIRRMISIVREIHRREKIDVVHVSDPLTTGIVGLIAKKITGAKLIIEVNGHLLTAAFLKEKGPKKIIRKFIYKRIIHLCFSSADLIKFLSNKMFEEFSREIRFNQNKCIAFFDYVATDYFQKSTEDEKYIFFAGFPFYLKGVDILIRAFKQLADDFPEYRLLIMGFNNVDLDDYRKMAEPCSQIDFLSPCHYDGIRPYFQKCSFLVLPSRTEGMGRVIIEAMACGKAVVAADVGGIPEVVDNGITGFLFEPENVEELKQKMRILLGSPEIRRRMGMSGYENVEKKYSSRIYLEKFVEMVESICPDV